MYGNWSRLAARVLAASVLLAVLAPPAFSQRERKRKDANRWPFAGRLSAHGVWTGYMESAPERRMVEGLCFEVVREGSVASGQACTTDSRDARKIEEAGALMALSRYPVEVRFTFEPHGWSSQEEVVGAAVRQELQRIAMALESRGRSAGRPLDTQGPQLDPLVARLVELINKAPPPAVLQIQPGSFRFRQRID